MSLFTGCNQSNLVKNERSLRINLRVEPVSLDPRKGNDMVASQLHFMLFEGLLRLNSDMTLSPAQADSYEMSPDGKVYTFHLKDSKWSDGSPVTAYDFEKSWKSLLNPDFYSPDTYLLYAVKNAKAAKMGEVSLEEIGIHSRDAKTLVVELERPSPHFLQIVACSVLLPVNAKIAQEDPNWSTSTEHFVSNGPFELKEWKLNKKLVLEKNPHYAQKNAIHLDQILIEIINDEKAVLALYQNGHFDVIGTPLSFFPAKLNRELKSRNLLTFFPAATTKFLAFNSTLSPFHNANIRRALGLAIDRQAIVNQITQLKEQAALNVIPPVLLSGKEPALLTDGDRARAKVHLEQGLEELGISLKELSPISFMYCSSEINHLIAQELKKQWFEILDIQVTLENVEFKTLHERSRKGEFSIGLFAWLADYGDPMNILERFEYLTNHRNYSKWENETYNALLNDALTASSRAVYLEKIREAERFLVEEMPITCLYHDSYAFLIHDHVQGFAISPLGHIYFDRISINPR